jgi:hypothetical protein
MLTEASFDSSRIEVNHNLVPSAKTENPVRPDQILLAQSIELTLLDSKFSEQRNWPELMKSL